MIGSYLVKELIRAGHDVVGLDRSKSEETQEHYEYKRIDLQDIKDIRVVFDEYQKKDSRIDRIIHLAALAHTERGRKYTYEDYYRINVECAKNIFIISGEFSTPILFISTVDVYGFTNGTINANSPLNPITYYGRSKAEGERVLQHVCEKNSNQYTIFRFSPVYTKSVKRDIQKRYYLKYPTIAYMIGCGMEYEVLSIDNAIQAMVKWVEENPENTIRIIKDPLRMNTAICIRKEKRERRAKIVIRFPYFLVQFGYMLLLKITGENKYTYLLNKALHPLRSI